MDLIRKFCFICLKRKSIFLCMFATRDTNLPDFNEGLMKTAGVLKFY